MISDPFAPKPDPFDPLSDAATEAAMEAFYAQPEPVPVRHPAPVGHVTRWPTGKPVPDWGQDGYDPFSTFVDETTGVVLRQGY
jgi:hypothetical protein